MATLQEVVTSYSKRPVNNYGVTVPIFLEGLRANFAWSQSERKSETGPAMRSEHKSNAFLRLFLDFAPVEHSNVKTSRMGLT